MCRNLLAGLLPLARMQAVANDLLELLISSPCKNADSCMHAKLALLLPCHFRYDTIIVTAWANHHQSLSYNFQFLFGHTNNYSYLYSFAPHATSLGVHSPKYLSLLPLLSHSITICILNNYHVQHLFFSGSYMHITLVYLYVCPRTCALNFQMHKVYYTYS